MKVKEAAGSKCFILTLNRSDNALPEAVLNATAPVSLNPLVSVLICGSLEYFYTTCLCIACSTLLLLCKADSQWLIQDLVKQTSDST